MGTPVSVCIVARDEAENIRRCLKSVQWADDRFVVLDDRTTDATESIASEFGARVIRHVYEGDVEQRNFSLDQARHDWVFSMDADECSTPALASAIGQAIEMDGRGASGFRINRLTYYLGRWLRHGDFYPDWQLRLFKRSESRWEGRNPHGRVVVAGRVDRLSGDLQHYSYRDLADQVERIQAFSEIQAQALHEAGIRTTDSRLVLRPPFRFLRSYLWKRGFLDGVAGFIGAGAIAFYVFLKYAKLWERSKVLGRQANPSSSAELRTDGEVAVSSHDARPTGPNSNA